MKLQFKKLFATMLVLLCSVHAYGTSLSEDEELALYYGDKSFVTIATGTMQPITRAPSVATVVTAEDIAAIGATDLDEALETVPGLHVSRSPLGYNPIYTIRGISTQFNPQVLMLVNGIPITGVTFGDRSIIWGGMPVENIERIEVIRGPGSALYGADAFSGVINIITKTAADINSTELGLRASSLNSRDAWLQYGGSFGKLDTAAYLHAGRTDGSNRVIKADALTGTPFTLAPGQVNLGYKTIDSRIDASFSNWRLRAGYKQIANGGTGAGVASVLDPQGENFSVRFSSDLTYEDTNFARDWGVNAQISYLSITEKSDLFLYPPNTNFGLGAFPNGVIGNPYKWERHLRFNTAITYTGLQKHNLRIGAGTQKDELYRVQESRNYVLVSTPFGILPAPLVTGLTDVTNTQPFITPHNRRVKYVFAQDEWNFNQDWYLTAGVRHDQYSDSGNTTNPRVALVWDTAYNLTSKLLYGKAFRPPSFAELYNINNPVALGNLDLKPETNETIELAFAWQASKDIHANLGFFRYQMKDILRFVQDTGTGIFTAQNTGKQNGQGAEVDFVWDVSNNLRLSGNYAYQRSIDEATNKDAGNAPRHQVYARADWHFIHGWNVNTQLNYVAKRKREPGDTRATIADYNTVDVTLGKYDKADDWGLALSVRNLFDADAREPSPAPGLIPDDFPLSPREWRVELNYKL